MRRTAQAVAVLLALAAAGARADGVVLGLGGAASVVGERVHFDLPAGVSEQTFAGLPAAADPSSLQVRFREAGVALEEWRHAVGRERAVTTGPGGAVWRPGATPAAPASAITLRVRAEHAISTDAELTYLTTGLVWSARYAVLVRGNVSNEEEKISMDLSARVRIENATGRAFEGARVLLVGEDRPWEEAPRAAAGFLILDENPLDDLWRDLPPERRPRFSYALPKPVDVPDSGAVDVHWLEARRRPVDRLYRLDPEAEGAPAAASVRELHRWLVTSHAAPGEAPALPAGWAEVQAGGQRVSAASGAWIPHTAAGERVMVDLGAVPAVTGERIRAGRSEKSIDSFEDMRIIRLTSRLGSPIQVEVEERPPTTLGWEVVRSTAPYRRTGQQLVFTTKVDAGATVDIRYSLRVHEPVM